MAAVAMYSSRPTVKHTGLANRQQKRTVHSASIRPSTSSSCARPAGIPVRILAYWLIVAGNFLGPRRSVKRDSWSSEHTHVDADMRYCVR
ncbi:hypothetical protein IG631_11867 [Alternaria alternata]|nr:hypothetical protein IG631_11867 [Alternaria alternata]